MRKLSYQVLFVMACAVSACSSVPPNPNSMSQGFYPAPPNSNSTAPSFNRDTDPYWSDPQWDAALLDAVQSVVQDPTDTADQSAPSLHGTVQFTLVDGEIEYPEITESTGEPELDRLMLQQVVLASVPKPTGPHAAEPHEFIVDLDMPTPFETFEYAVYAAIDRSKVYPKSSILSGAQGITTVGFDYLDGKASNIAIVKSNRDRALNQASVQAVSKAALPASPVAYAGKTLHMRAMICYSLNYAYPCQTINHAIQVIGTRIVSTTVTTR